MHEKSALRAELVARRAIACSEEPDAGLKLVAHFPRFLDVSAQTSVAAYMPFRTEIDVLPLVDSLISRGAPVALPRMISPSPPQIENGWARRDELVFYKCDPDNEGDFEINKMGLREPRANLPVVTPNILLVPLLGFDRQGNRLGYGKGYYDQALASLRAQGQVIAIGVAFAQQEVPLIPTQPHDQRLDWIITQNQAYRVPS